MVLAGGEGKRLQPFVRQVLGSDRPKQFCTIVGTRSMLRHTWDRARRVVDPERIVTVITGGHERYLDEEAVGGVPGHVLVQPANRDTAAGLLLPLLWIARRAPRAAVIVFPADHFVWEEERFAGHARIVLAAATSWPDRLTLLGVEAESPEAGYGWIEPRGALAVNEHSVLYAVRRFWEKPDCLMAARLYAHGCLWNACILGGRLETYLGLAAACLPEVFASLRGAEGFIDDLGAPDALAAAYERIPPMNLSRALLARCPNVLLVHAIRGISWSDWGEPGRVLRTLRRFRLRPPWLILAEDGVAARATREG